MTTDLEIYARPTPDAAFLVLFNRLAVALRLMDPDEGTVGVYFDVLRDLPATALEAGADALMKETGRRFFPSTAEWRTAAEVALTRQRQRALEPDAEHDPRAWVCCSRCLDTGWILAEDGGSLKCSGVLRNGTCQCGRRFPHEAGMTYTEACSCRASNVNWQRKNRTREKHR
ncbi:MAG: hypothetical protein NUW01_06590 [Gemmatimonadaceae bacterium]|nr:hypothetical protein [Gemmatimonadaceae bacterium]